MCFYRVFLQVWTQMKELDAPPVKFVWLITRKFASGLYCLENSLQSAKNLQNILWKESHKNNTNWTRLEMCAPWSTPTCQRCSSQHNMYVNVALMWSLGHFCVNVIWGHCCATICSNNHLFKLLHLIQQYDFQFHCCTMTPQPCMLPTPIRKMQDRQTWTGQ